MLKYRNGKENIKKYIKIDIQFILYVVNVNIVLPALKAFTISHI